MRAGFFQYIGECGLALLLLGGALALFGRALVFRHHHADLLGQVLHRFDKAQAAVVHQKAHRIAVHAAAEAVVGLARRADDEAGGLFPVEGAQALVVDAGFFQLDMAAHNVDDVGAGE